MGPRELKITLLTSGNDPHYALGLVSALASHTMRIDFVANDEMQKTDAIKRRNIRYYNLRGDQRANAPIHHKVLRVLKYYGNLVKYAKRSDSDLFHILWLDKFKYVDRMLLCSYYRFLGKKLVYTAHNINAQQRDGVNSFLNELSLRFLYRSLDHIFVHTVKMKNQLIDDYACDPGKITVIPLGINNVIPRSRLSRLSARRRMGFSEKDKIVLFFGNIAPYKGVEHLIEAFEEVRRDFDDMKLIIAGQIKNCKEYWNNIEKAIRDLGLDRFIFKRIEYIPDEQVEVLFKAADVSILPYVRIFQSGVLGLSYNFGLPVIASDVGSLNEEVIEGKTGLMCTPGDPADLARQIKTYFQSDLFSNLESKRAGIRRYAQGKYSWDGIGDETYAVYERLV